MKLFRVLAAATVLTMAAGTAHAQEIANVGGWSIYKAEDNCRALASVGDGTIISVALYKGNDHTSLIFLDDKAFAGVQNGSAFEAELAFVQGESLDTSFSSTAISGMVLGDGKGLHGVYISSPTDRLLTTIGKSDVAGLLKGSDVVISVKVDTPTEMVAAVRSCVSKL